MPSKESSKLPIAGIASIAVATAALVFTHDVAYVETRPPQTGDVMYELSALEQVDARLWQDPIAAVDEFEFKQSARVKFDADSQRDHTVIHSTATVGTSAAPSTVAAPAANIAATTSAATGSPPTAPQNEPFKTARYGKRIADIQRELTEYVKSDRTGGSAAYPPLTVLAVTMDGSPSVGAEEGRRRERYAVVSALGAANFAPIDDEHIGYIVLHYAGGVLRPESAAESCQARPSSAQGPAEQPPDSALPLPFEIFESSKASITSHKRHVIVWWVDNLALHAITPNENWLLEIQKVLTLLGPCGGKNAASVRIIGPSNSDAFAMLGKLNSKVANDSSANPDRITLLSPYVTSNLLDGTSDFAKNVGVYADVISTLPSDKVVFNQLTDELGVRAVPICNGDSTIVLLSEWDTEYGRRASDALKGAITATCDAAGHPSPHGYAQVESYSFLRGLDGVLVGSRSAGVRPHPGGEAAGKSSNPDTQIEWPETADQRDYVRRLGEKIADRHRQTRGIQAIGIVASDTHDKLLLLQALRPKFPALPFFTTDADARLAHPAVQRWARNLIVASGYGLLLNDQLQRTTPPFRDVYQTSTYLATLLALQEDASVDILKGIARKWTERSEMLEVGKNRLVVLGPTTVPIEPKADEPSDAQLECKVGALLSCAKVTDSFNGELIGTWQKVIVLCLLAAIITTIATLAVQSYRLVNGFPWKSVRGLALALCVLLVPVLTLGVFLTLLALGIWKPTPAEPGLFTQGVSSVPVALCWCLALSMTIFYLLRIVTTMTGRFAALEKEFLSFPQSPRNFDDDRRRFFAHWVRSELFEKNAEPGSVAHREKIEETWALYKYHSFSVTRSLRVLLWWLFMYFVPVVVLMAWLPMPIFPIRGPMHSIMRVLAPAGFMSLMALIALVADTVFACSIFVIAVGRRRNEYPPSVVESAAMRYHLLPSLCENVDSLLDTEIVAARTTMVADYLYYPFVVMAILSLGVFATYEHWAQWPGRLIIIGLAICEVSALWGFLRWSAERARATALDELQAAELRALRHHVKQPNLRGSVVRQCKLLRQKITLVRNGAYAAFQDQPIVRALLLPLGGAGAAQIWEYLTSRLP